MKITVIKEVRNEQEMFLGYEMIIESDEKPDLKLGECVVKNI